MKNKIKIINLNANELDKAFKNKNEIQLKKKSNFNIPILKQEKNEKIAKKINTTNPSNKTISEHYNIQKAINDQELIKEIKYMLSYLDTLLGHLPEKSIKEFALSEDYDRYINLLKKFNLEHVLNK